MSTGFDLRSPQSWSRVPAHAEWPAGGHGHPCPSSLHRTLVLSSPRQRFPHSQGSQLLLGQPDPGLTRNGLPSSSITTCLKELRPQGRERHAHSLLQCQAEDNRRPSHEILDSVWADSFWGTFYWSCHSNSLQVEMEQRACRAGRVRSSELAGCSLQQGERARGQASVGRG